MEAAARSSGFQDLTKAARKTGRAANLFLDQTKHVWSAVPPTYRRVPDLPEAVRRASEAKRRENLILDTLGEEGQRRKFRDGLQVELTISP